MILAIPRCMCYTICVNFHIDPSYLFCACGCQTHSHFTIGGIFVQRQKPLWNHPLSGWFSRELLLRRSSLYKKALASKAKSFDARAMLHRGTTLLVFSQRKSNSNRITDGPPQPTLFHFGAELRKVFAREGALRLSSAGHFLLRTSHATYFRQCFYIYYYTHFGLLCQAPSQIWELCQNNRLI